MNTTPPSSSATSTLGRAIARLCSALEQAEPKQITEMHDALQKLRQRVGDLLGTEG
jgi:hypothetical protein